ncbi:MAG: hypothetical protein EOP54_15005 [Sphingobacteriales bacterium]|nr:MAG: hypothetical protein EOP54_15005 [Sphingobacteriales bacterium]
MVLNNKILSQLVLGLSLAVASCDPGQPATQQPGIQPKDTIKERPELSKEDTANVPVLRDPNNCPACGMG